MTGSHLQPGEDGTIRIVCFRDEKARVPQRRGNAREPEVIRSDAQLASRFFQIAGHTDAQPLNGGPFKDNWGLSAMRARTVLVFLIAPVGKRDGGGGLDATHLHAAGYGDTDPVASNDTPQNREHNRRVELVLMPNVEEMLDLKSLI